MSRSEEEKSRDSEGLELLIKAGVPRKDAPDLLLRLKETFGVVAARSSNDELGQTPELTREFRTATDTKEVGRGHRVADAPFETFLVFGDSNLYAHRQNKGYGYQCNVFGYIHEVYGEWIMRGVASRNPVTQADIKAADPRLYWRMYDDMRKKGGMPDWLYLPLDESEPKISMAELERKMASFPTDLKLLPKPRARIRSKLMEKLRAQYGD